MSPNDPTQCLLQGSSVSMAVLGTFPGRVLSLDYNSSFPEMPCSRPLLLTEG